MNESSALMETIAEDSEKIETLGKLLQHVDPDMKNGLDWYIVGEMLLDYSDRIKDSLSELGRIRRFERGAC